MWLVDQSSELSPALTIGLLDRISQAAADLGDADLGEFAQQYASELASWIEPDRYSTVVSAEGDTGQDDQERAR